MNLYREMCSEQVPPWTQNLACSIVLFRLGRLIRFWVFYVVSGLGTENSRQPPLCEELPLKLYACKVTIHGCS